MPTVKQIIDGLECFLTHQHECLGCLFNPCPGTKWVYGCIKGQNDIVKAAQETLRKYEEVTDNDQRMASALDYSGFRDDRNVRDGNIGVEQE